MATIEVPEILYHLLMFLRLTFLTLSSFLHWASKHCLPSTLTFEPKSSKISSSSAPSSAMSAVKSSPSAQAAANTTASALDTTKSFAKSAIIPAPIGSSKKLAASTPSTFSEWLQTVTRSPPPNTVSPPSSVCSNSSSRRWPNSRLRSTLHRCSFCWSNNHIRSTCKEFKEAVNSGKIMLNTQGRISYRNGKPLTLLPGMPLKKAVELALSSSSSPLFGKPVTTPHPESDTKAKTSSMTSLSSLSTPSSWKMSRSVSRSTCASTLPSSLTSTSLTNPSFSVASCTKSCSAPQNPPQSSGKSSKSSTTTRSSLASQKASTKTKTVPSSIVSTPSHLPEEEFSSVIKYIEAKYGKDQLARWFISEEGIKHAETIMENDPVIARFIADDSTSKTFVSAYRVAPCSSPPTPRRDTSTLTGTSPLPPRSIVSPHLYTTPSSIPYSFSDRGLTSAANSLKYPITSEFLTAAGILDFQDWKESEQGQQMMAQLTAVIQRIFIALY